MAHDQVGTNDPIDGRGFGHLCPNGQISMLARIGAKTKSFPKVPAQGFEPWTIGLKVGSSDVRDVPPEAFETLSVFEID